MDGPTSVNKNASIPFAVALLGAAAIAIWPGTAAQAAMQHVRGTIVSSTASSVTIKTATGNVTVGFGPKATFAGATPGTVDDIAPGKFLGIASVPGGSGPNSALEVVVFADSMRGAGEGDYPWDSASPEHAHSSMTNGTVVMPAAHSTMTNATVGSVSGAGPKTITMAYKGGSRTLLIPADTPVVHVAPGTKALLAPGSAIFAVATESAHPNAAFIVVGENGTKLPM